ncbi:MAG: siderophore-interacting protein [Chloroflexi bacterium]|nr:siderophore-interacting protein [Chloroflexota bacterium]
MLVLGGGDRPLSRRYSIRRFDRLTNCVELNVVAHGVHGPGAAWASSTQPGDRVNGVGPRGKILLDPDADWHLFVGDETAAPASLAMLEGLPPDRRGLALLEVSTAADELASSAEPTSAHQLRWLHRGDTPAIASKLLLEAINSAQLPDGRGHVYIAGEVQVVAALQRAALARGLAPEQLSPKAYWGRGKSNAPNGEPDKGES